MSRLVFGGAATAFSSPCPLARRILKFAETLWTSSWSPTLRSAQDLLDVLASTSTVFLGTKVNLPLATTIFSCQAILTAVKSSAG